MSASSAKACAVYCRYAGYTDNSMGSRCFGLRLYECYNSCYGYYFDYCRLNEQRSGFCLSYNAC